ncbi:MAG TPA: cupin domain-containing protein [Micromonosporaceae bacterium]|nr:cupin domain-containing protein [Micromonosporaceae bacterium]
MDELSLETIGRDLLAKAAATTVGRSAQTVYGGTGKSLRQTLMALRAGSGLAEHENPGEATLLVLQGRVELNSGDTTWPGQAGDLLVIPQARHSLQALDDSVVLLTVAKLPE